MKVLVPQKAKRKLGQNFLVDQNVLQKIIRFIEPHSDDVLVEIGAGTGAVTRFLADHTKQVIAIEADAELLPYLEKISGIRILHADIRKIDLCTLAPQTRIR